MLDIYLRFLPVTICLFWAFLLFYKRESNSLSQNILLTFFIIRGVSFFAMLSLVSGRLSFRAYYLLDIVDTLLTPFVFPLIYLYFKSLAVGNRWKIFDYLIFLPGLFLGFCNLLIYLLIGDTTSRMFADIDIRNVINGVFFTQDKQIYDFHFLVSVVLFRFLIIIECLVVGIYAFVIVCRYHKRSGVDYSGMKCKSIKSDNRLLVWGLIAIIFSMIFVFVGRSFWIRENEISSVFCVLWAIVYFVWGYNGVKKKYPFENLEFELNDSEALKSEYIAETELVNELSETDNYSNNECLHNQRHAKLQEMFEKMMNDEKLFCQSDLRTDTLARQMYTNRLYVSQMMKEYYGCSFSEYMNRKRVEYSIELLQRNPQIKLEDLAQKTGFVNAQTLSRAFRQYEGLPPKEWCKKHRTDLRVDNEKLFRIN